MNRTAKRTVVVAWSDELEAWLAWTPRGLHYIRTLPPFTLLNLDPSRKYAGREVTA